MTPQPTSIIVKEDLTIEQDKPQPTILNQEDKKDLSKYVKLSQSHKHLDTKGFFTPLKSSQQIKQISNK